MITSVNLHEFWMMETELINTRNMVAFLMALGVLSILNIKDLHYSMKNATSILFTAECRTAVYQ